MVIKELSRLVVSVLVVVVGVQANALRDPTIPLYQQPKDVAAVSLELNAIVSFDGEQSALINGRRVVRGDKIDGATILKVSEHNVVYEFGGKEFTLRMRVPVIRE